MSARDPQSRSLLVIGYGNTLREDDGVGPRVAALIGEFELPGVEVLACPQLAPEHAELVAAAGTVVFVDAAMGGAGPVRLRRLRAGKSIQVTAHAAEPRTMLALALEVYGRVPSAWMLALPAERMGYGDELSFTAQRGVDAAVRIIRRFVLVRKLHEPASSEARVGRSIPDFVLSDGTGGAGGA